MKTFASTQHGITLIELMIVITILSILLFIGTSLTRAWIDRSQVTNTLNIISNSVQQAKVMALRNPENQPLSQTAVHLCLESSTNTLHIVRPKISTSSACDLSSSDNVVLQSTALASGISIQQSGNAFNCLAFNAAGVVVSSGDPCASQRQLRFTVSKHNETADITLM